MKLIEIKGEFQKAVERLLVIAVLVLITVIAILILA